MNKVITINLGGNAYQLEEDGYIQLQTYLETATGRLRENPDREEILSDIEGAIAEKFRAKLSPGKTVVLGKEVAGILDEMGPIEADTEAGEASAGAGAANPAGAQSPPPGAASAPPPRRLYRIPEDSMIAGVCTGIAAYLGIDPTFVRLGFVLCVLLGGSGIIAYVVLAFVMPEACTAEEKAAATGSPTTTQEFIRRAKEGYYEAIKHFPDKHARREWKRQFKCQMREHAWQWRYHWSHGCGTSPSPVFHPLLSLGLPVFSLLIGVFVVAWVCALISLLATGTVFGVALPASVPVWLAALLLLLAYGVLMAALKAARRMCAWGLGSNGAAPHLILLVDAAVWVLVAIMLMLLAIHYFPELRAAVHALPASAHQAMNDIRDWWQASK